MVGIYKIAADTQSNTKQPGSEKLMVSANSSASVLTPTAAHRLVALTDEHSLQSEKFRMLANRLVALRTSRQMKIIHVTSSVVGEGKSLVSANLAVTLARRPNERVLLLEGDLRKPSLARLFGLRNTADLASWWSGKRETSPVPYGFNGLNLWFLPASVVTRATEVLESPKISALLADWAKEYDWVIIDSPPLLAVADSNIWARFADGTIMVVRSGVATKKALEKALESMDNAKLIGFVMNDSADRQRSYYYCNYYRDNGREGDGKKSVPNKKL